MQMHVNRHNEQMTGLDGSEDSILHLYVQILSPLAASKMSQILLLLTPLLPLSHYHFHAGQLQENPPCLYSWCPHSLLTAASGTFY